MRWPKNPLLFSRKMLGFRAVFVTRAKVGKENKGKKKIAQEIGLGPFESSWNHPSVAPKEFFSGYYKEQWRIIYKDNRGKPVPGIH